MTFWKLLWDRNKKSSDFGETKNSQTSEVIIKDFKYKDKNITILLNTNKEIDLYALEQLCDTVGWVRRPVKKVKIAIENSFLIISLYYNDQEKNQLIAFARATSDNTFNATIWDVVVHPEFQRKGLGRILINEIIKQLRYYDINTITLFADPQVLNFYKHLGFVADPDGVKGMFWYPN